MQFDTGTYAEYVSSSSANNLIKHQNNKPYCSISFWAKNLSATTTHQVLWISKINGTDFKMYISPNSNKLQLIYYTGNWSNSKYTESAEIPTLFSANWKHFVIISNGSNGIIKIRDETENSYTEYLNLDISGLGNMGVGNETFTLSFGVDDVASGSVIDDFRIYDKVLSDTEINGIYGEKSLVVLTSQTDYKVLTFNGTSSVNFPMDTKCDILLVGDNKYTLESGVTLNGDYTFELGSTSKIIKTADISYTTELLAI